MNQPAGQPSPSPSQQSPEYDAVQEIRLAAVMYGGVSLAIYMNGVAQELLHLVRATAPKRDDPTGSLHVPNDALGGTERVYRDLGKLLGSDVPLTTEADLSSAPVRTRFVVDILSGTS